jgi:hypothetical protein
MAIPHLLLYALILKGVYSGRGKVRSGTLSPALEVVLLVLTRVNMPEPRLSFLLI